MPNLNNIGLKLTMLLFIYRATASKLFSKNIFLIINKIENLMVVVYNSVVIFRIYLEHFVYR